MSYHPSPAWTLALAATRNGGQSSKANWPKHAIYRPRTTGLNHREIEQAVISVFLSSQPIGHKALTRELMLLLGAGNPDKIELEKALHRWTEVSWFLDEAEAATATENGSRDLPKAWRLGNRPNLRQMHDDACANRVPPALVESQLVDAIEKQRSLTMGAAAAGARVHTLPDSPRDVRTTVSSTTPFSDRAQPPSPANRVLRQGGSLTRPPVRTDPVRIATRSFLPCLQGTGWTRPALAFGSISAGWRYGSS